MRQPHLRKNLKGNSNSIWIRSHEAVEPSNRTQQVFANAYWTLYFEKNIYNLPSLSKNKVTVRNDIFLFFHLCFGSVVLIIAKWNFVICSRKKTIDFQQAS